MSDTEVAPDEEGVVGIASHVTAAEAEETAEAEVAEA